jgi:hypothetical protein
VHPGGGFDKDSGNTGVRDRKRIIKSVLCKNIWCVMRGVYKDGGCCGGS